MGGAVSGCSNRSGDHFRSGDHLSFDFQMTHSSNCWRVVIVSSLSSSSIESQIYAIVCVSSAPWPSGGSPSSSVSINSFSLSSCRVCGGAFVSHQIFLFFVALGKKVGADIAGSPCTPSARQTRLIVCRMCLVGVKILTVSSCLWDVQDS